MSILLSDNTTELKLPASKSLILGLNVSNKSKWHRDPKTGLVLWGIPADLKLTNEQWEEFGADVSCSTCNISVFINMLSDLCNGKEFTEEEYNELEFYCSKECADARMSFKLVFEGNELLVRDAPTGTPVSTIYETLSDVYGRSPDLMSIDGVVSHPDDAIGNLGLKERVVVKFGQAAPTMPTEVVDLSHDVPEPKKGKNLPFSVSGPGLVGFPDRHVASYSMDAFNRGLYVVENGEMVLKDITRNTASGWFLAVVDLAHELVVKQTSKIFLTSENFSDRAVILGTDGVIKFLPFVGDAQSMVNKTSVCHMRFIEWLFRRVFTRMSSSVKMNDSVVHPWYTAIHNLEEERNTGLAHNTGLLLQLIQKLGDEKEEAEPLECTGGPTILNLLSAIGQRTTGAPTGASNLRSVTRNNIFDAFAAFKDFVGRYYLNDNVNMALVNCQRDHIYFAGGRVYLGPFAGTVVAGTFVEKRQLVEKIFTAIDEKAKKKSFDASPELFLLCSAFRDKDSKRFYGLLDGSDEVYTRHHYLLECFDVMNNAGIAFTGRMAQYMEDKGVWTATTAEDEEVEINVSNLSIEHVEELITMCEEEMNRSRTAVVCDDVVVITPPSPIVTASAVVEYDDVVVIMPPPVVTASVVVEYDDVVVITPPPVVTASAVVEYDDVVVVASPLVKKKKKQIIKKRSREEEQADHPKTWDERKELAQQCSTNINDALKELHNEGLRLVGKVVDTDHHVNYAVSNAPDYHREYSLDPKLLAEEVAQKMASEEDDDESDTVSSEDDEEAVTSKKRSRDDEEDNVVPVSPLAIELLRESNLDVERAFYVMTGQPQPDNLKEKPRRIDVPRSVQTNPLPKKKSVFTNILAHKRQQLQGNK